MLLELLLPLPAVPLELELLELPLVLELLELELPELELLELELLELELLELELLELELLELELDELEDVVPLEWLAFPLPVDPPPNIVNAMANCDGRLAPSIRPGTSIGVLRSERTNSFLPL